MNVYEDDSMASAVAILAGSRSVNAPDGIQEALDREVQRVQGAGGAGGGAREGGAGESSGSGTAGASTEPTANWNGSWHSVEGQATATPSVTELHQKMMQQHLQQQHSLLLAATQGVPSHLTQQAQLPGAMTSQAQNQIMLQNLLRQQIMVLVLCPEIATLRCSANVCILSRHGLNRLCVGAID